MGLARSRYTDPGSSTKRGLGREGNCRGLKDYQFIKDIILLTSRGTEEDKMNKVPQVIL